VKRRQLLQALGMGGLASLFSGSSRPSRAAEPAAPLRVVFFVTAHGHTPNSWTMPIPEGSSTEVAERPLAPLAQDELSTLLQPLHAHRDRLLVVEGLANTINLANLAEATASGLDINNHSLAVAGLLTANKVRQTPGQPCTGGARSIDQELAQRLIAPGRFGSRVYGYDYTPNLTVAPFSFLGAAQASPIVASPQVAYQDLLGGYIPAPNGEPLTRAQLLNSFRPSVLDSVAHEYELLAPRLDAAGRERLDAHRTLIRELETNLSGAPSTVCDTSFEATDHEVSQFMRLIRMAFACDLTRVVTFVAPVPQTTELGYPATETIHRYEHQSIVGGSSCGATYNATAEQAIVDLGVWYATHFAYLLDQLDSVVEGNGTMLDNTIVVWLTELATGGHDHEDTFAVIAGGGNAGFRTGRYVRYPRTFVNPMPGYPVIGPATNRLFVSVLRAMGQPDDAFGLTSVSDANGGSIPLVGPLAELFG
jgi:hypothetical protein